MIGWLLVKSPYVSEKMYTESQKSKVVTIRSHFKVIAYPKLYRQKKY